MVLIEKQKTILVYTNNINELVNKLNPIIKKYDEIKNIIHNLNNEIATKKNEKKHIVELKEELRGMNEISSINKLIIEIIKNDFIDDFLTKNVIPSLCNHLNSILSSYVNFGLFMIYNNKKVSVLKKDKNNQYSNALKMSGYETLMTNIAFRLAINNLNKQFKTEFFIIDEAFAFCDDESTSKMQNLFDYMRKNYKYVIVISHNEQIKAYTDTDVSVIFTGGYSKVVFGKNKKDDVKKIEEKNHIELSNNNFEPEQKFIKKKKTSSISENTKKTKQDLSAMTEEEKKEYKKNKKKEWEENNKAKVSEYNKKKYMERSMNKK
jgi:energy-coupling factor transporter ATP-binding protein EcfA2